MSEEADVTSDNCAVYASETPFDALLRRLRNEGSPGLVYESLRRRLIQFYRLHVPAEADELADVALDRLARRIHEGILVASVPLYALGIARMVLHEAHARRARQRLAEADPTLAPDAQDIDDIDAAVTHEFVMNALSICLDATGPNARALILAYYGAAGAERIAARQHLAADQHISLNALRNRAMRLRDALEQCVRKRVGWPERP